MNQRSVAIDFMKFLAVLFIYNAHSTMLYPTCKWLSTGGYISDALFFFCSGYGHTIGGKFLCCRLNDGVVH